MHSPESPANNAVLERVLSAACGYAELGLPDMAWEELESLEDTDRTRPDVQELVLSLLVREERWEETVAAGVPLCADASHPASIFIHTAFALHELGRTPEARATLLSGPKSLSSDPIYHYNLACYLAVCGELTEAGEHLRNAFRMDSKLRLHASTDPDLKALQGVM
jgi:hypothetical protein